jgi:hypothetical protein
VREAPLVTRLWVFVWQSSEHVVRVARGAGQDTPVRRIENYIESNYLLCGESGKEDLPGYAG